MAFKRKHARNSRHRRRAPGGSGAPTPTPTPVSAPAFTTAASIQHDGSPVIGEQLLGVDGVANYPIVSRRWLLGSTVLATTTALTAQAGTLVFESLTRAPDGREAVSRAELTVGDGSAATITSASGSQQYARSTRYQQASADRAGAWDIAGGSDAALYEVLDAARGIYGLKASAVAATAGISAARTDSYVRRFTPTDGSGAVTQTFTNTVRPIGGTGMTSEFYAAPLTGASGTRLDSLTGWTVVHRAGTSGTRGVPVLTGDGKLKGGAGGSEGDWAVIRYPTGSAPGSVLEIEVAAPTSDYSQVGFVVAADGFDNGLLIGYMFRTGNNSGLYARSPNQMRRQAGVVSEIAPSAKDDTPVYPRADGSTLIRITRTPSLIRFTVIGRNIDGTATASRFREYDLSGGTYGSGFGFGAEAGLATMVGSAMISSISYTKSPTTLSLLDSPVAVPGNTVRFAIDWRGNKPTGGYEHRFRIGSGAWSEWLIGESAVADGGTSTYDASYPTKGDYETQVRMRDDTPTVVTSVSNLVGYTAPAFSWGENQGPGVSYASTTPYNDFGLFVEPYDKNDSEYAFANQGINGTYDLELPPGFTLTGLTEGSACTFSGTVLSVNGDLAVPGIRRMGFSPRRPAYVTAKRRGVGGEKISADFVNAWNPFSTTWRMLDASMANRTPVEGKAARNNPGDRRFAVESQVPWVDLLDAAAKIAIKHPAFERVWYPLERDLDDAEVAAFFTEYRDHPTLPKRVKFAFELGNEDFNFAQFMASRRTFLEGVRKGYASAGATAAAPGPAVQCAFSADGNAPSMIPAGTLLMTHASGRIQIGLYRAKVDVPAGSPAPPSPATENEFFSTASELDAQRAGNLWRGVRLMQIIAIGKSVMGEAEYYARCEPMLMGFSAPGNITSYMAAELSVPGLIPELRRNGGIGAAWYFYADGMPLDATPQQIDDCFDAAYPIWQARIRNIAREAVLLGIRGFNYEGGDHAPGIYYGEPRISGPWNAYQKTQRTRVHMARLVGWVRRNLPGLYVMFFASGGYPWGLRDLYSDVNNPRFLGAKEGLGLL